MTRRKFFLLFVRKFSFTRHVIRLSLCKILTNFVKLPAFFSHFVQRMLREFNHNCPLYTSSNLIIMRFSITDDQCIAI